MRANWTGGVADACRDRWESLKNTEEYIAMGRTDLDDYRDRLITELASYYEANIMPEDVRLEYEARNAELDTDSLLDCLDDTDGIIDLEEDAVHIDTRVLAAALDAGEVIDLDDEDGPALDLDEFMENLGDDLELINFEDGIL